MHFEKPRREFLKMAGLSALAGAGAQLLGSPVAQAAIADADAVTADRKNPGSVQKVFGGLSRGSFRRAVC
jgi:hypothetical protein